MNKYVSLTPDQYQVIFHKGTEAPFSGNCITPEGSGTYLCRGCGQALYRGDAQFLATCGWPSFDDDIVGMVKQLPDQDGRRTEIVCGRCNAHLGHIFHGEGYTTKNTRHCVNSLAIEFVRSPSVIDTGEAIVAGGCFWGIEYFMQQQPGVLVTEVGYTGGSVEHPSYRAVCQGKTGHYEAVRVLFDLALTSYENIIKTFFNTHDPAQPDGQGADRGQQYQSAIFVYDSEQKSICLRLIETLEQSGLSVVTVVLPVSTFWPAEADHQSYYQQNGQEPYCHRYSSRFD